MPKLLQAVYNPLDDAWWRATADLGDKERQAREKVIERNWKYYSGDHPDPLKRRASDPNYNVILNFAGQALDTMVAFLGVPHFEIPGASTDSPDGSGQTKSAQQLALEGFWDANDLKLLIVDLLLSGFIAGHTFLKLLPPAPSLVDGTPDEATVPRVELIDPKLVTVFWSSYRLPLFWRLSWKVDETERRTQDIVPEQLIVQQPGEVDAETETPPMRWHIIEWMEKNGRSRQLVGEDVWDYPFAPILDGKNAPMPFDYYGRSDLSDAAIKKNNAANFVASNIQKIIFHHAGPQTVITGGKLPDDFISGPGVVLDDLPADAKVTNLEMVSDLASSSQQLMMLRSAFFENLRVVDRASVKDKLGDLTNFAVRMLYGAQLDAGYDKQSRYGRLLAEAGRRALALIGQPAERVNDVWDDPLPQDRSETVQAVAVEDKLGIVSATTLLGELGHDPAVEASNRAREQTDRQRAVGDMLAGLGNRGMLG